MKKANKQYSKLNNEYELTFKDQGTFDLCEDAVEDIPSITYNFVSISDLAQCENYTIIDVLGVVKSTGELTEITTKVGKELKKKEIVLVDKSSNEVSLTLWGNNAESLDLSSAPIIAGMGDVRGEGVKVPEVEHNSQLHNFALHDSISSSAF